MKVISGLFKLIGFLTCLFFLAAGLGLYSAGKWLVLGNEPVKADAMVVLAGELSRPLYAADLYNKGYAPLIYVGRPKPYKQLFQVEKLGIHLPRDDEIYEMILLKKKVPKKAIRFHGHGYVSTVEEAESLKAFVGDKPLGILVVTSPYHMRRAKTIFDDVFPNAKIHVVGTPYEDFEPEWWTDQLSAVNVVLESAKLVFYHLGGAFRSTDGLL